MNEVCPNCGAWTDELGELTGWCKACEGIHGIVAAKECATCKQWKPPEAFTAHHSTKDRLRRSCRACETDRRRRWRYANLDREKATWKRSYDKRHGKTLSLPSPAPAVGQ